MHKDAMMRLAKRCARGQNIIEYALVIAIVAAAATAMSTYVFRAMQSQQKKMSEELQRE